MVVTYQGREVILREECANRGLCFHTVYNRIRKGYPENLWFVEKAPHNTPTGPAHPNYVHGKSNKRSRAYEIYHGILQRCYNPNRKHFHDYGGRGIVVCDEWLGSDGFLAFLADMGEPPTKTASIERRDCNGNYSKDNCYWLERRLQSKNRRNSVLITHNGETDTSLGWAKRLGLSDDTVRQRLRRGMPLDKVLSTYRRRNQFDPNY